MKISEHFSLTEFTKSSVALRKGLENEPPAESIPVITEFCNAFLEPFRAIVDRPIHINSGYRSPKVNKAAGGVKNSQHVWSSVHCAVDLEVPSISNNMELYDMILKSDLPFDQLIAEFVDPEIPNSGWIHVSWSKKNNRRQYFVMTKRA